MSYKYGQAPNLPWWRIQNMSDEEIEKFNDGFMIKETTMADRAMELAKKQVAEAVHKAIYEEGRNAGIEEAANMADIEFSQRIGIKIRKLKK